VLYPYSSVFLAALPEAGKARGLPRGQAQSLVAAVDRLDYPVRQVFVAIPSGNARFGNFHVVGQVPFASWIIVRRLGPFLDSVALLQEVDGALQPARRALLPPQPAPLEGWFELNSTVLCEALATLGSECVSE
jgi:hypothetical protein